MSAAAQRSVAVDAIKAAGIVTIVLIHALRPHWDPGLSPLERWLGELTRFGVPGFLLASGYLYAGARADTATMLRRLRRILLPYLVASLLAQLWHHWRGVPSEGGGLWMELLFGASFGPYYYVFVIACLVLATPVFASLPRPLLVALTAAFVAAQWVVEAAMIRPAEFFWHLRSPFTWWGYFLVGWLFRVYARRVRAFVTPRRAALGVASGAAVAVLTGLASPVSPLPPIGVRTANWLDVYAILAALALGSGVWTRSPGWLRTLSDATYTIYLYHLFFVHMLRPFVPPPPLRAGAAAILVPWLGGLAGGLAIAVGGRRLLGARARDWLGA